MPTSWIGVRRIGARTEAALSQPGWYPDPYGSGRLRWWNGQNWTENLNPQPADPPRLPVQPAPPQAAPHVETSQPMAAPQAYGLDWGQPQSSPLDLNVRGFHLHADEHLVGYGNTSLPWAHVEWIAYWAAAPMPGQGLPQETQWIFQVGRHPFNGGPRVEVVVDQEDPWSRLVELCRRLAEPRLVAEMTSRVRAGDSIDVAQGLTVHPGGVRGNRVSLSWSAISGASVENGRVWIQQSTGSAAVLYVPQQNPNAVIIPALLASLKG